MKTKNERSMSRAQLIVISLLVSIAMWVAIDRLVNPDVKYKAIGIMPVIRGEEQLRKNGYMLANREEIPPCSVTVVGKRGALLQSMDNIGVELDVSGVNSAGTVSVGASVTGAYSLKVDKQSYTALPLTFEKLSKNDDVSVIIKKSGESDKAVRLSTDTEKITVSGTEENVSRIKYCIVDVDISGITGDGAEEYPYYLADENREQVKDAPDLRGEISGIRVKSELFDAAEVSISNINVPQSLEDKYDIEFTEDYRKKTVRLGIRNGAAVPESLVGNVKDTKELSKGGAQEVEISFDLDEENYYLDSAVKIKANVTVLSESTEKVNIKTTGLGEGLRVASVTPEFDDEAVSIIRSDKTKGSVEMTADISGLGEGEHTVELKPSDDSIKLKQTLRAKIILISEN